MQNLVSFAAVNPEDAVLAIAKVVVQNHRCMREMMVALQNANKAITEYQELIQHLNSLGEACQTRIADLEKECDEARNTISQQVARIAQLEKSCKKNSSKS